MAQKLNSDKELQISASVGIKIFSGAAADYAQIFSAADKSVYAVKTQGRNGFSVNESPKQIL